MLQALKPYIPHQIRRLLRAGLATFEDKSDWEFKWQKYSWVDLWKSPEVKAKCLEYWRRFRHLDDIKRIIPFDNNTTVLDVGCGIGSVLHYLPGNRTGVDPLGERYKTIYDYPFEVVTAPGERLPFSSEIFDVVFSSNCIDHTTDPDEVLKQIKRVLKSDGHFVLTCEVFSDDLGARNKAHPHSMTENRLRNLAMRHFKILAEWNEPWYGMRGYCLGEPPTDQREFIFILQKP
jgi:SAM-dependent methyltransferase